MVLCFQPRVQIQTSNPANYDSARFLTSLNFSFPTSNLEKITSITYFSELLGGKPDIVYLEMGFSILAASEIHLMIGFVFCCNTYT